MSSLNIITTILVTLAVTVGIGYLIIPTLHKLKFGQAIREEGPSSHQAKAGTPTMGGVIFFFSIVSMSVIFAFLFKLWSTTVLILLLVFVGYAMIGFLDDILIIIRKQNLGLTSLQKLVGQIVVGVIAYFLLKTTNFSTEVFLPFTSISIDLGMFYVLFLVFWLVGFSNAVNLTDGLDGLVAGSSTFAFSAFAILALIVGQNDVALVAFVAVGAMIGFLYFNRKPAKVFMGDTGSLALGGLLAMISIVLNMELLLLFIGLIYVIETLSVIIQVTSFKLTGKRVFKMSPLHHHFELSGWSEKKVVTVFWVVALIAAVLSVLLEVS